jgi:hypothetical protein
MSGSSVRAHFSKKDSLDFACVAYGKCPLSNIIRRSRTQVQQQRSTPRTPMTCACCTFAELRPQKSRPQSWSVGGRSAPNAPPPASSLFAPSCALRVFCSQHFYIRCVCCDSRPSYLLFLHCTPVQQQVVPAVLLLVALIHFIPRVCGERRVCR